MPRIVAKQDIPDGFILRMTTDVDRFILLEYDSTKPADIGPFDIGKVNRKGNIRYMPFVTSLDKIIQE